MILLGLFMQNIGASSITPAINTHIICGNVYTEFQYLKNNALRLLLSDELNRAKLKYSIVKRMINRNIVNKYNIVLSRYYDVNYNYNSLTYAEKTLLEVIVSLTY
jgi:hypothetical protein